MKPSAAILSLSLAGLLLTGSSLPAQEEAPAKAPEPMVRRTLDALGQTHLVQEVEGGYRLGFHSRAIHISDIIDALRTELYPATCPLGACKAESRCALCWSLVKAEVAASEVLHRQTLADVVRLMDTHSVRPPSAELAG